MKSIRKRRRDRRRNNIANHAIAPVFSIRIYIEKGIWHFINILTDVLPNDVNTFASYNSKANAWNDFIKYLNYSSTMISNINERT